MALKINPFTGDLDVVTSPGGGPTTTDFAADTGSAVPTVGGVITIDGGTGITTSAASNTVTLDLDSPVTVANGGSGNSSYVNGELLIGNTTGNTLTKSTLTAGTGITINNTAGAIEIVASGLVAIPVPVASGGTGNTSYTAGSVIFSNGSILTEDNSNLFWDDTNNRLGIGTVTPLDTLHVAGSMDLVHTATEADDHAFEIDCDAAGFGDVKCLDINYITGAITGVQDEECILLNIDESASLGGIVNGYEVLATAEGSAVINGYTTGINVNPIVHQSGLFGDADNILNKAVDVTAALASGGAGAISIFVADNDTITIGDAATWDEHEIILATGASGGGVAPTFEYSTGGAAYSSFSPSDGTNGFRNTGVILWDSASLTGWATATSGDFEIRITRTRNTLSTTPIIDELQISGTTEFKWDKSGDVNINSLTLVTDLAVTHGGTGASTLTDGGVLLGSGTGAVTALGQATNGQLVIGSTGADPVLASLAAPAAGFTITGGAGTVTFALADGLAALEALAGTGIVVHTAADTYTERSVAVTSSTGLSVSNGDGVSGNPTLAGLDATSAVKGVATFDENDFLVTSGDVALADRTRLFHGWTSNIGIAYSAGVFTVQGADGNALSSTNKGWVALESLVTPGKIILHEITANSTFQDSAGTTTIIGNLFGLTAGDNWGTNDIPFWLYCCTNTSDASPIFGIARQPAMARVPVAVEIGTPASAVADEGYSMFMLSSVTVASYVAGACATIGAFRMRFTQAATDDWTVQALMAGADGVGNSHEGSIFVLPTGVMGASSGTHIQPNGGTAATFSTTTVNYWIDRNGLITVDYIIEGDGGTDGAGAVTMWAVLPHQGFASNLGSYVGSGLMQTAAGVWHGIAQIDTAARFAFAYQGTTSSSTFLINSDYGSGSRQLRAHLTYYVRRT